MRRHYAGALHVGGVLLAAFLLCLGYPDQAVGQALDEERAEAIEAGVSFGQLTRPIAEVMNREDIEFLLDQLLIFPQQEEAVTQLDIIDINGNGFGPDDVVIVYPSQESFMLLDDIPDDVQELMSSWALEADYQVDAGNLPASVFNPEGVVEQQAEQAILFDLLQSLQRNYDDIPVNLRFDRDANGFTMQLWDYDEAAMQYEPSPVLVEADTVARRDILHVVRSDSVIYDMFYLFKSVEETVYLPEGEEPVERTPEMVPTTQEAGLQSRQATVEEDQ